jgi:hypothetical protein
MVLETSVLSTFNHLTRLEAQENFIVLSRRESLKSYIVTKVAYFSMIITIYHYIVSLTLHNSLHL